VCVSTLQSVLSGFHTEVQASRCEFSQYCDCCPIPLNTHMDWDVVH